MVGVVEAFLTLLVMFLSFNIVFILSLPPPSFLPSYCHLFFAVVVVHTGAVVSYIKDVAVVLIMGVFVVVALRWCFAALLFVVVVVVVAVGPRADVVNVAALTALYVVATSVDIVGGVKAHAHAV